MPIRVRRGREGFGSLFKKNSKNVKQSDMENSSHIRFLGRLKVIKFKNPSAFLTKTVGKDMDTTARKEFFSNSPLIFSAKRKIRMTRRKEKILLLETLKISKNSQKEKRNREER